MGITQKDVAFLSTIREMGVSFERTLTIGRQNLYCDESGLRAGFQESGRMPDCGTGAIVAGHGYAEGLFHALGASEVDSLDASSYERSNIVHDLNDPLPEALKEQYSVVFDGGSLEHVFNFPQAIKNCLSAVAVGGHFVSVTACNNLVGHGFYQFSPEVFYRILSPVNGFEVRLVMVRAEHRWGRWRAMRDPAEVGGRVEMTNSWPTLIYVVARRVRVKPIFETWPQQSDYTTEWATGHRATRQRIVDSFPRSAGRAAKLWTVVFGSTSGPGHFHSVKLSSLY